MNLLQLNLTYDSIKWRQHKKQHTFVHTDDTLIIEQGPLQCASNLCQSKCVVCTLFLHEQSISRFMLWHFFLVRHHKIIRKWTGWTNSNHISTAIVFLEQHIHMEFFHQNAGMWKSFINFSSSWWWERNTWNKFLSFATTVRLFVLNIK